MDLSVGTPCDPPPPGVAAGCRGLGDEASPRFDRQRGPTAGRSGLDAPALRGVDRSGPGRPCVGTRNSSPRRHGSCSCARPDRDTVLAPALAYPTYAMGARLAGWPWSRGRRPRTAAWICRRWPTPTLGHLCRGSTARPIPTGALTDLGAAAAWGRDRAVPVLSDRCYVEFTWQGAPTSIVQHGPDGVLAVHSLSERSNMAGVRVGFYAGDGSARRVPGGAP